MNTDNSAAPGATPTSGAVLGGGLGGGGPYVPGYGPPGIMAFFASLQRRDNPAGVRSSGRRSIITDAHRSGVTTSPRVLSATRRANDAPARSEDAAAEAASAAEPAAAAEPVATASSRGDSGQAG